MCLPGEIADEPQSRKTSKITQAENDDQEAAFGSFIIACSKSFITSSLKESSLSYDLWRGKEDRLNWQCEQLADAQGESEDGIVLVSLQGSDRMVADVQCPGEVLP